MTSDYFPSDYASARERFLDRASARGARLAHYPIDARGPRGEPLSIDAARIGAERPRRLLILISGTHGVEGFAGAALQRQWLDGDEAARLPADAGCLLIHALNPYGFARLRRANEHNVDINRNALERFPGPANPAYRELDGWLNPPSPPGRADFFWLRGGWLLLTRGWGVLKQATAQGQYEFPRGLFYGGSGLEASTRALAALLADEALRNVTRIVAIDIHTGLGRFATYKLLVDQPPDSARYREMARCFDARAIASNRGGSAAYRVHGGVREYIERRFEPAQTYAAVLEFGTVPLPRLIVRLRRENRAYHHAGPDSDAREAAALREAFCPTSPIWRRRILAHGERVFRQARALLARDTPDT